LISGELSSFANKAYSTLKSPLSRAVYLLELKNIEIGEEAQTADMAVLSIVMEAREDVLYAETDGELEGVKKANDGIAQRGRGGLMARRSDSGNDEGIVGSVSDQ
jgi:DnaJ-domain-containing protein 1